MEVQSKPWYESVTVWGVVVSALAGLLGLFGIMIGPSTQQAAIDIVPKAVEAIATKNWVGAIESVVALIGIVMTMFGRNQAVQPVHYLTPFKVSMEPKVVVDAGTPPMPTEKVGVGG